MNKLFRKEWSHFLIQLNAVDDISPRRLFEMIEQFLENCSPILNNEPFEKYSLKSFLGLRFDDYVEDHGRYRKSDAEHFVWFVTNMKKISESLIAQTLRDTLEAILVFESERSCQRCKKPGMGVFKNEENGRLVYLCSVCGWAEYTDGLRIELGEVEIAKLVDLKDAGLI